MMMEIAPYTSRYKVTLSLVSLTKGIVSTLDDGLPKVTINNLYNDTVFPIIHVETLIGKYIYNYLLEDIDDLRISMNISRYKIEGTETDYSSDKILPEEFLYKNIILKIFDIKRKPEGVLDEEKENPGDYTLDIDMSFYCFVEDHLLVNRTQHTMIFNNKNVFDIILALCSKYKIKSLLIDTPENTKVYPQVIIPPLNFTNSIYYLQEVYGIFKHGVSLYFDFEYCYIIKKDFLTEYPQAKESPKDIEKIIFTVYPPDKAEFNIPMNSTLVDTKNNTIEIVTRNYFNFVNSETTVKEFSEIFKLTSNNCGHEQYTPNNVVDNFKVLSKKEEVVSVQNTAKEIVRFSKYANDFVITERQFLIKSNMLLLVGVYNNLDIGLMRINKKYYLDFKDDSDVKKYCGWYRLNSFIYTFKGSSTDLKNAICLLRFSKLDEQYHQ